MFKQVYLHLRIILGIIVKILAESFWKVIFYLGFVFKYTDNTHLIQSHLLKL